MYKLLLVTVLLQLLLPQFSLATCPDQCQCESKESKFVPQTSGIVFNCRAAGLTDTNITDDFGSEILYLELMSNQITHVDSGAFPPAVFGAVQKIDLSHNVISSLAEDAFSGLSELRSLSLADNRVTTLPDGVFGNITRLELLDLSLNAISSLAEDAFAGLSELRSLWLGDNDITTLPDGVFGNNTQLTFLGLSHNAISSLAEDAFAGLSELQSLKLGDNNVTTLPDGVFGTNTRLAYLDLSGNAHLQLPPQGFNVSTLTWLDLSRCGLEDIPPSFFDETPALKFVYLSHNRLTQVEPQALRAISGSVRYLDMFANQFTKLQSELLEVPASCKLFLHDNPFHCDCEFLKAYLVYKKRPFVSVLGCKTPENLRSTRVEKLETALTCE